MPKFKEGDEVLVHSKHAMGEVKARGAFGNEWKDLMIKGTIVSVVRRGKSQYKCVVRWSEVENRCNGYFKTLFQINLVPLHYAEVPVTFPDDPAGQLTIS